MQAWRTKDRDENELKILTTFQKEKRKRQWEKRATTKTARLFLVLWLFLVADLVAFCHIGTGCFPFICPVSPKERGWLLLGLCGGSGWKFWLREETTRWGWNKQNDPVIMADMLLKDRNLPAPYYLWSHKNQWEATITEAAVTVWPYIRRQSFRRHIWRFESSQCGLDLMEIFLNVKIGFRMEM